MAESEGMLQRLVDEFDRVCKWRKFKVNAGKSRVMVLERAREQTINFAKPYRVGQRLYLDVRYGWGRRKGKEKMGSRIVWVKGKVGLVKSAWVCIYAPVNVTSKKD